MAMARRSRCLLCRYSSRPLPIMIASLFFFFLLFQLSIFPSSKPRGFSMIPEIEYDPCTAAGPPFSLDDFSFCTGACRSTCFPRVRRLCISSSEVIVCDMNLMREGFVAAGNFSERDWKESSMSRQEELPSFMRFRGERAKLPLVYGSCTREKVWVNGLSLVADQRFLPYRKPNPHHEAEKLIPATFLIHQYETKNITLYWFSQKEEISEWSNGFIKAVDMEKHIEYVNLPGKYESPICFEDAIILSAPTNVRYIPDWQMNDWLRRRVLQHCSLPIVNTSVAIEKAVILDRRPGPRHIANSVEVAELISRVLKIPVEFRVVGNGSFCHQVNEVAEGSLLLVPHGSQNVNLIFSRPGAIIVEVFPFLYHNNALRNYTHAADVHIYTLLGLRPPRDVLSWLFSLLGWDNCYYHVRLCKNYSRRQPIYVNLPELENLLALIVKIRYNRVELE